MRRAALLWALLTTAALAWAGTPEDPEITDEAGDTDPAIAAWGDITAAWFNETATDIVATMAVADLTATPPLTAWYVLADAGAETFGWGCTSDQNGAVSCFHSHWDRAAGPTDFNPGTGSASGGTITMNLPKAFAPNATAGTALTRLEAGTGQVTPVEFLPPEARQPLPLPPETRFHQVDTATATRDYLLGGGAAPPLDGPTTQAPGNATAPGTGGNATGGNTTAPPGDQAPARTPGPEVPLLLAASGLVAAAARRRRGA